MPGTPNMSIVPALDFGSGFHRQKLAVKLNVRNGSKTVIPTKAVTGGSFSSCWCMVDAQPVTSIGFG
jgi:hypothetical protein